MDLLDDHFGVVSAGDASWSATISVHASSAAGAALRGFGVIQKMADKAGMPTWPLVRAGAVLQALQDSENARPTLPDLVSVPEAAEILDVSQQRVRQLAGSRGFPEPVYELRTGKLWLRDAIVAFGERWDRKPGRPDKGALLRERANCALLDHGMTMMDAMVRLSDDRIVVLEIKVPGSLPARHHCAARVLTALSAAGLGVMPEDADFADEIEAYLADGRPAVIYELKQETAR
jgi:hypothetical protein